jgi:class 3 adenylate cyclase
MELALSLLSAGEPKRVFESVAERAYEAAERLGGGARAARAAEQALLALIYHWGSISFTMPEYRMWHERADKHAAPESRERVMADCFISWTHWTLKDQETCWKLRRPALELARRIGDPDALAYAMFCFIMVGGPIAWEQDRQEVAKELGAMDRSGVSPSLASQLLYSLAEISANNGDRGAADHFWGELDRYAQRVPDPYVHAWQVMCDCYRLAMKGEHEKVLEVSHGLVANAEALGIPLWGQLIGIFCASGALAHLGRFEELRAGQWAWASLLHGDPMLANHMASSGHVDEAREIVRKVIEQRKIGESDDLLDGVSLVYLLGAAAASGDKESAALLEKRLEPYAGWYSVPVISAGRALGMAAQLRGDAAKAREHFLTGLDVARRVEDRVETALTHFGLARVLFEHFPEERAAAASHLNTATREAQAMKMKPLLEDCLALKLRFQGITSTDVNTSIDTVARVVEAEKPDLRTHAAPDGTVTIMFSDIEGSTAMADRLGDARFMDVLREHNAIIREQVKAHSGFEVKSEGDGFMVAFQSAGKALACASAIQKALLARNESAGEPVRVRMGLHAGEVIKEGEDFFGRNVIMAARVASQAQGGEILASAVVKTLLQGSDVAWGPSRTVALKGLSGDHEIWAVEWRE